MVGGWSSSAPNPMPSDRQTAFIRHYAACLNGSEAARRAGYSPKSAAQTASDLLARKDVRRKIQKILDDRIRMGEGEIIARLERQTEASMGLFLKPGSLELDVDSIHHHGDLITRIWFTAEGPRLQLVDSTKALELLGKTRALFVERTLLDKLSGMEIADDEPPGHSRAAPSRDTEAD